MSVPDELQLAGKRAFLKYKDGRGYSVEIIGSRARVYGHGKVFVKPLDGLTGETWVNLDRLSQIKDAK